MSGRFSGSVRMLETRDPAPSRVAPSHDARNGATPAFGKSPRAHAAYAAGAHRSIASSG
ncbi:hypothetical protein BURMUCF2_B0494 [Burkholderia multivorans CF2]|nr:hypothetical protein BURMUCF2_B0494 [Burkholderia multivorans CF2]